MLSAFVITEKPFDKIVSSLGRVYKHSTVHKHLQLVHIIYSQQKVLTEYSCTWSALFFNSMLFWRWPSPRCHAIPNKFAIIVYSEKPSEFNRLKETISLSQPRLTHSFHRLFLFCFEDSFLLITHWACHTIASTVLFV